MNTGRPGPSDEGGEAYGRALTAGLFDFAGQPRTRDLPAESAVGARPVDGGWVGTVADGGWCGEVRIARVTPVAGSYELALDAAERWYGRPDDGRLYRWIPSADDPELYDVVDWPDLRPVELEPIDARLSRKAG
jgi:hypothetical protein